MAASSSSTRKAIPSTFVTDCTCWRYLPWAAGQLSEVHPRQHHVRIPAKHLAGVGRQRVEVSQLGVGHFDPAPTSPPAGLPDRPE